MAEPVDFPQSNLTLTAPPGVENVVPLPVNRAEGRIVSCWQLSAADLDEVARTGRIWLSVWGDRTHPPVLVTALEADLLPAASKE